MRPILSAAIVVFFGLTLLGVVAYASERVRDDAVSLHQLVEDPQLRDADTWGPEAAPPPMLPVDTPEFVVEPVPRLVSVTSAPLRPRARDGAPEPDLPELEDPLPFRVDVHVTDLADDALGVALDDPDVAWVVDVERVTVPTLDNQLEVLVAGDPLALRALAPPVTADHAGTWGVLAEGEVAISTRASRSHRVNPDLLGDVLVGATADIVHPDLADGVAGSDAGLGSGSPELLIAARPDSDVGALVDRLGAAGTAVHQPSPRPYTASLVGEDADTIATLGTFTYVPARSGQLTIDPAWIDQNIVRAEVPLLGTVRCHRMLIPQMTAALTEIIDEGLDDLIDTDDYGGCFNPRTIGRDPHRTPSMHAWGLSFDINVATNLFGDEPQLDPRVVEVFESHGFHWGGHWRTPDGMHFELGILNPDLVEIAGQ